MATRRSTFKSVVRQQRSMGKGAANSLITAFVQKKILENIDPRNIISDNSLLKALFPDSKLINGYRAKGYRQPTGRYRDSGSGSAAELSGGFSMLTQKIEELNNAFKSVLDKTVDTSIHTKNVAKNTTLLPRIATEANLTRKNIQKVVKLLGGKESSKADLYFQSFAAREREYEAKYRKEKRETKVDKLKSGKETTEKGGGLLSSIFGGLAKSVGKGVGIAAIGLGIGGFLTGISFGIGQLKKVGDVSVIKDLLVSLGEGLKAFDTRGLLVMGGLFAAGAIFGTVSSVKGIAKANLGIAAIGAGIGGFMAGLSYGGSFVQGDSSNVKNLLQNLGEGLKAFDVNGLKAMGVLLGAGALFGAYKGGDGIKGGVKALGAFGGAILGITAIGLGIGGFLSAMSWAASFSTDNGASVKEILKNVGEGLGYLSGIDMAVLGGLIGVGGIGGGLAGAAAASGKASIATFAALGALGGIIGIGGAVGGFLAAMTSAASLSTDNGASIKEIMVNISQGLNALDGNGIKVLGTLIGAGAALGAIGAGGALASGGITALAALGAAGGIVGIGASLGLFLYAFSETAKLSNDKGASARDIMVNIATGLNSFNTIDGSNLAKLGTGMLELAKGITLLFAKDVWSDIVGIFRKKDDDVFGKLANDLKKLEKINGANLFNLGNGLHHLSLGLKNLATLTSKDLENVGKAVGAAQTVPDKKQTVPESNKPETVPESNKPTKEIKGEIKYPTQPTTPKRDVEKEKEQPKAIKTSYTDVREVTAKREGGSAGYDAIFGYGKKGGDSSLKAKYGKNLSEMTIREALQIGDQRMKESNSGAMGKYGFLPSTIRANLKDAGLSEDDLFNGENQEKLYRAFTDKNIKYLKKNLGRDPSNFEIDLANAQGAGGAVALLRAFENNPDAKTYEVIANLPGYGKSWKETWMTPGSKYRKTNPKMELSVRDYLNYMKGLHEDPNAVPKQESEKPTKVPEQDSKPSLTERVTEAVKGTAKSAGGMFGDIFDKLKSGGLNAFSSLKELANKNEMFKDAADIGSDTFKYIFGENDPLTTRLKQFYSDVSGNIGNQSPEVEMMRKQFESDLGGLTEMLNINKEQVRDQASGNMTIVQPPVNIPASPQRGDPVQTAWAPVVDTDHMKYFMNKYISSSYRLV